MNFKLFFVCLFAFVHISACQANEKSNSPKVENDNSEQLAYNNTNNKEVSNDRIDLSRRNAITNAVEIGSPCIVGINVTEIRREQVYSNPFEGFFDHPLLRRFGGGRTRVYEYQVKGLGSGFIVSPNGYILTNHHVAGHASKIVITMTNGEKYDAELIGSDAVSDIALLKIDAKNLPYLKFTNSNDIYIGEWAIAFGNPFGLFDVNSKPTVTVGIVSNSGVSFTHNEQDYVRVYRDMIQTDAAISSGNSGGPLLNALGEVIGMNTTIYSTALNRQGAGSIGIGFAIPSNRVQEIYNILKSKKTIDRSSEAGIDVREIDDNIAEYLNLKKRSGVFVNAIRRKSPADNSGLEPADIILEIDGRKILRKEDYDVIIYDSFKGKSLNLRIQRGEEILTKNLVLI